jgi:hypothetical protein
VHLLLSSRMGAIAAQPMAELKPQRHAAKWFGARCILALLLLHVAHAWRFTSLPPEYEHLLANTDEEAATGATRALLQVGPVLLHSRHTTCSCFGLGSHLMSS